MKSLSLESGRKLTRTWTWSASTALRSTLTPDVRQALAIALATSDAAAWFKHPTRFQVCQVM
jgi:hypothetical protein